MGAILEHVSLPEAVGRALRHRILNNELPAETRLVEANLAAEFWKRSRCTAALSRPLPRVISPGST
jgi:hypothetical protein